MARMLRAGFCAAVLAASGTNASQVTPMEKVITLLKSLSSKVEADGAKEAAQYDKYACFCKEQADEKLYNIEKSTDTIATLSAEIKELDGAINELNGDISKLSKKISKLEGDIDSMTKKRAAEHDAYLVKAKDHNEAIDACASAIDALKSSKKSLKGAKVDLAQVSKAAGKLLGKGAPSFEYQSNDIIATLQDLLATFKSMKKNLDFEEHDIASAFESRKLGLSNEKRFASKERSEKQAVVEAKTEKRQAAQDDKDDETKDMDADQKYLDDATKDCEQKALIFDQRSKTRSDELKALSDATAELQKGAESNYAANEKLVGLAAKKTEVRRPAASAPAFVQISEVKHDESRKDGLVKKVLELLRSRASKLGSTELTNIAMRMQVGEDHFVKVRTLIKDLIDRLQADAQSEKNQKQFCDDNMEKAMQNLVDSQAEIEEARGKITTYTSNLGIMKERLAGLQSQLAELKKGALEATELRNDDKEDNLETIGMTDEAIESVKMALELLSKFYKNALVQTKKYTPPNADRSGKTFKDGAPDIFQDGYHGSQSESKGIIGILDVILSDFARTKKVTEDEEAESKMSYDMIMGFIQMDIDEKNGQIKKAQGKITDIESDILQAQQTLADNTDIHSAATDKLDGLKAMCVEGEETWEERKKKREDEIEALKDALDIFENWKGF